MAKSSFESVPGLLRQATDAGEGVPAYITAREDGVRFTLIDNSLGRPDRTDVDVPLSDVDVRKVDKRTAIIVVDGEPWIFTAHDPIRAPLSPSESSAPSLILSQLFDPIRTAFDELRGLVSGNWITGLVRLLRRSMLSALFAVIIFAFGWMSGKYGGAGAALLTTILVVVSIVAGSLWGWRTQTPAKRVSSTLPTEPQAREIRPARPVRDPVQEALAQRLADAVAKVGSTSDGPDEADTSEGPDEADLLPATEGAFHDEDPGGMRLPPVEPLHAHDATSVAYGSTEKGQGYQAIEPEPPRGDEPSPAEFDSVTPAEAIDAAITDTPVFIVSAPFDDTDSADVDVHEMPALHDATAEPVSSEQDAADAEGQHSADVPSLSRLEATRILASLDGRPRTEEQPLTDNLELIHGVGPSYAALLVELGFSTFEAIANIDDRDLEEIEALVGPIRWRIERDGWIDSARRLLEVGAAAEESEDQTSDASTAESEAHQAI